MEKSTLVSEQRNVRTGGFDFKSKTLLQMVSLLVYEPRTTVQARACHAEDLKTARRLRRVRLSTRPLHQVSEYHSGRDEPSYVS